jgi:hypothetical protein
LDKRFVRAFTEPSRVRILGRFVYPFCLKHRLHLLALESPLVMEGKEITAADLLLAVKVCAEEPIDRVTWRDQWEALKMKHRPGYLNEQLERFVAFTLLTQWPKFWEKQGKTSGSVNSMPWVLQVVCNLMKHGFPEERAWMMPEAQAVWMSTGFNSIAQGGSEIELMTTDEEELQAELLDQSARVEPSDGPQT